MIVLVVNCGSSSIKYRLYDMPAGAVVRQGSIERIGNPGSEHVIAESTGNKTVSVPVADHEAGMRVILDSLTASGGVLEDISEIEAVGHRVVHGGESFTGSVEISGDVQAAIEANVPLAPLHNPPNLVGIEAARSALPHASQVACFDTAFHARIPEKAFHYAVPGAWYDDYGIRRYGFHGTSHRYVARRAAELLHLHKHDFCGITCHLGNGCSMAAIRDGYSVDTSMGMTPLEGLVMGTRSGDIDPAVLFLLLKKGHSPEEIEASLNKKSGLLGVSGASNDMRTLLKLESEGHQQAALAIDVFCYRIRKYIGAYMAVLETVHGIVFTGGIGERAAAVRERILNGLDGLGIGLDRQRNESRFEDGLISSSDSRIPVFVIATDEERAIASDTYQIASLIRKSNE